jgi:hypothetical protein
VVSGGARGVDEWAEAEARDQGLEVVVFEADWKTLGRKAGPLRNQDIIAHADQLTAFWDGKSRGTLNTIVLAAERALPITIFDAKGNRVHLDCAMEAAKSSGVVASIQRGRNVTNTSAS